VTFGRSLGELQMLFGHSSKRITLEYLHLQAEESDSIVVDVLQDNRKPVTRPENCRLPVDSIPRH
jgi:hypothetical protein